MFRLFIEKSFVHLKKMGFSKIKFDLIKFVEFKLKILINKFVSYKRQFY